MPMYRLYCQKCDSLVQRLLKSEQLASVTCKVCGTVLERRAQPPEAYKYETLDNGVMNKRLERFQNAEELYKNRKKKED